MADHTNTAFSDNEPTVDADLNEPDLGSEVESTNDPSVFKTPVKPGRASSPIRSPSNSSSPAQQSDTGSDPTPTPAIENAGPDLETFDWTNLQAEFEAAMESQRVNDDALQAEWAQLMNVSVLISLASKAKCKVSRCLARDTRSS